ncbi:MAG: alcohol dehydrogenase catalytic domain-containing protein, partial [Phycisphaerales bacterium]|nr:alcohol dehydrogenase catalytic domain-containing protein [Phycisphaerales bacterium]
MRALWFDGSSASLDRAAPEPQPPPGAAGLWALIRPTRAAISEQDLDVARGGTGFVGPLGREWVGVVEALMAPDGAVVTGAEHKRWVGKRVVGGAMIACGACDLCRGGLRMRLPAHSRFGGVCLHTRC